LRGDLLLLLTPLRQALERIERKAQPLQFLAVGEALKRVERLEPGLLASSFPEVDWKGAMGFRDVIAHQYFDLDAEQVLLICRDALPAVLAAIQALETRCRERLWPSTPSSRCWSSPPGPAPVASVPCCNR